MLSAPSVTLRSSPERLHRDVLGEEPRQRRAARAIAAVAQRGERLACQQAAAGGIAEQPQVGRGAGERVLRALLRQQPLRRAVEAVDGFAQARGGLAEGGRVAGAHIGHRRAQLVEIKRDRAAAFQRHLARHQIERLDAVGALVDRGDAGVAVMLGGAGLLDEAHAAVHLHAEGSHLDADIGGERLRDRRQQRSAFMRRLARGVVLAAQRAVERDTGLITDRPRRPGQAAHGEQHALDVGVMDDGAGGALLALARIAKRLLQRALGDRHALQADRQPRPVHHGEHAGHALVLLADEVADRAAVIAIDHGAGGRGMDAELVLDRMRAHVIARAVRQELGDQEQRNALGAGRGIGQAGEHEVDDVGG